MLYLSNDELQYAISKCSHNAYFRVAIAFNSTQHRKNALSEIKKILDNRTDCHIKESMFGFDITFENGSFLFTVNATDNARGKRSHLLIVDEAIDRDIIETVLTPYEIPYKILTRPKKFDQTHLHKHFMNDTIELKYLCKFIYDEDVEYPDVSEIDFLKILNTN